MELGRRQDIVTRLPERLPPGGDLKLPKKVTDAAMSPDQKEARLSVEPILFGRRTEGVVG
jgi:hypothetical protein